MFSEYYFVCSDAAVDAALFQPVRATSTEVVHTLARDRTYVV